MANVLPLWNSVLKLSCAAHVGKKAFIAGVADDQAGHAMIQRSRRKEGFFLNTRG